MKKLSCRDYEVVVFDVFQSSVFVCVVLQGTAIMTFLWLGITTSPDVAEKADRIGMIWYDTIASETPLFFTYPLSFPILNLLCTFTDGASRLRNLGQICGLSQIVCKVTLSWQNTKPHNIAELKLAW